MNLGYCDLTLRVIYEGPLSACLFDGFDECMSGVLSRLDRINMLRENGETDDGTNSKNVACLRYDNDLDTGLFASGLSYPSEIGGVVACAFKIRLEIR